MKKFIPVIVLLVLLSIPFAVQAAPNNNPVFPTIEQVQQWISKAVSPLLVQLNNQEDQIESLQHDVATQSAAIANLEARVSILENPPIPTPNPISYIVSDSTWKSSATHTANWYAPDFDDSSWPNAAAPTGGICPVSQLGDLAISTNNTQPMWFPTPTEHQTVYFRKTFYLDNVSNGAFQIWLDDDGDVYINGHQVLSDHDGTVHGLLFGDMTPYLQVGQNTIAIKGIDTFGGCQDVQFELTLNP